MYLRRDFVWTEGDYGEGWRVDRLPSYDPVRGFGVAHDSLEHVRLDGTIEDEAMAFGCILWGRGLGGYWKSSTFGRAMADDCMEFLAERVYVESRIEPRLGAEEERHIEELCHHTLSRSRWPGAVYDHEKIELMLAPFCAWLRLGFRVAEKRWARSMSSWEFCLLFRQVEAEVNSLGVPDSPLDRLVVLASPAEARAYVNLKPYVDPYLDANTPR